MSGTTNISDLPTAQLSNNTSNNVLLEKKELSNSNKIPIANNEQNQLSNGNVSITMENKKVPSHINNMNIKRENELKHNKQDNVEQNVMNELVTGLQQASIKGLTTLPSRDIPRNTNHITQDEATKANYIPPASNTDYITEHEKKEEIMKKHMTDTNKQETMDYLFEELQTPAMIALLYYLFKQPFIEKLLLKYFPVLFKGNGHFKWYGSLIMSILFGCLFYSFDKFFNHLSLL